MILEVIVQNGQEAMEAEKLGADRLELVSAIHEGGLTPSYGTIKQVLESVSIPVQIMVRPHSYHFCYTENDMQIINEDIKQIVELGGTGIVFGTLNEDNTINERVLEKVIHIFPELEITFHRAFDEVPSQVEAYHVIRKYKKHVKRILTSGGMSNCEDGKGNLRHLVDISNRLDGPTIMPGSGLSPVNIWYIHQFVQADDYHFGKAVRVNQSFRNGFDEKKFELVKCRIGP